MWNGHVFFGLFLFALMLSSEILSAQGTEGLAVSIDQLDDRLRVSIADGKQNDLFTEYRFAGFEKPILYPVFGPGDLSMTRHFPMQEGVPGEQGDHPHHKSIWCAHGDVNGCDFWSEKNTIRHKCIDEVGRDFFVVSNEWMDGDSVLCRDQTRVSFAATSDSRSIDYQVTVSADNCDLKFGDTKEGMFAIRTHPALRLNSSDGKKQASAVNSEGVSGKGIWGKNARWVWYSGKIDGQLWSVVMMDHPANPRHPVTWHAREYGLLAANPFGLSHFQGKPKGAGDLVVAEGESVTFRYRLVFVRGVFSSEQVEERFQSFAK